MYEKLNTDINVKIEPIDTAALDKSYNEFVNGPIATHAMKTKAKQLYEESKAAGLG